MENDHINDEQKPIGLSFAFTESEGEILIEFADGLKVIPEYVIARIGGVEKLKEVAPALHQVKFSDFIAEFEREKQRQWLNDFQVSFVDSHFRRNF